MNIIYEEFCKHSSLLINGRCSDYSSCKEMAFQTLRIGTNTPHWKMHLAHEMGHILHYNYISKPKAFMPHIRTAKQLFRQELIAWRIAKSIIKPEYWNEANALERLKTYSPSVWINSREISQFNINWDKLKIIKWR